MKKTGGEKSKGGEILENIKTRGQMQTSSDKYIPHEIGEQFFAVFGVFPMLRFPLGENR